MIDIYAVAGTFADPKQLAIDAAHTVKTIEGVPDIPMFRQNTAAFVHELPGGTLANVDGDETLKDRTWVLLTEAKEGGWGLWGHAHTNAELVAAARNEIAKLKSASS
jgi:hypothetical protein